MKRYDENLEVTVYRYDLFPPSDWGDDCSEEIRKMDAMWNKLVQVERDHVAAVRAVANPTTAEIDASAAELDTQIASLVAQRRALRKEARAKLPTPELDAQIDEAKAWLKAYRIRAKELRKTAYEANKEKLKELDHQRYANVTAIRQEATWGGSEARAIHLRLDELRAERVALLREDR